MLLSSSSSLLAAVTVTWQVADFEPEVAVMVAVPSLMPVTVPLVDTVATDASDVDQVTTSTLEEYENTVAVNVAVEPTVRLKLELLKDTSTMSLSSLSSLSSLQAATEKARQKLARKRKIFLISIQVLILLAKLLLFLITALFTKSKTV